MSKSKKHVKRIMLLASVVMLMLVLCGCRTRVTNNDEVSNVMYDETGAMQDTYQMRRDELSLGTAKKPIFTGLGREDEQSYDESDVYGGDAEALEDYDPEDSQEDYTEPEEPETETQTSGGSSGRGRTSSGSGGVIKRKVSKSTTGTSSDSTITVRLKYSHGTCSKKSITVTPGGTYKNLPDVKADDGYEFIGWYTDLDGSGSRVTSDTKVGEKTKSHYLYAYVKKIENADDDIRYTVIYTDGVEGETIFEDKVTGNLKKDDNTPAFGDDPLREGYVFNGWSPSVTEKVDTSAADTSSVIRYTATWKSKHDVWDEQLDATKKGLEQVDLVGVVDDDFVNSCKGSKNSDNRVTIGIVVTDDLDQAETVDGAKKIVVISESALKSAKNDSGSNESLYLKLLILSSIYDGYDNKIAEAKKDLGISTDDKWVKVITAAE